MLFKRRKDHKPHWLMFMVCLSDLIKEHKRHLNYHDNYDEWYEYKHPQSDGIYNTHQKRDILRHA